MAEPYRRRPNPGPRPSHAAKGPVRVGADFAQEYPQGDASSTEAFATLVRAGAACLQELDRFVTAHAEMPLTAMTVLAILDGADDPLTPSQIGERALTASATMTATLDLLERRDLVRRMPNPGDRRSTLVEITAEGRASADRLLPGIHAFERSAGDALTAGERLQLVDLLAKMLDRLAGMAVEPPPPLTGARVRPAGPDGPA